MPFSVSDYNASAPWLSALTQGNAVSVLVRAYRLTHEEVFLQVARRAMRTFELDIRDGGVSTSIGEDGVFFEEFAVYPASHVLNGYILALFGLYDYADLTGDTRVAALIRRFGSGDIRSVQKRFHAISPSRSDGEGWPGAPRK